MKEYTMTFKKPHIVVIDEVTCVLPDKPPQKDMVNYGKPVAKQKFFRTEEPADLRTMPPDKQEEWVATEYHRRKNGQWWLIKGQEIYISGQNYYFLNYWTAENGKLPYFRMYQTRIWQFWFHARNDETCLGVFIIKGRRPGVSEIRLCDDYETATRVNDAKFGLQHKTKEDAEADFGRITKAHVAMKWYMKPINQGFDDPKDGLIFKFPAKRVTDKSMREQYGLFNVKEELKVEPLLSEIHYKPCKLGEFDGWRLVRWNMGEAGKVDPATMNVYDQMKYIEPCLTLHNGRTIVGKMFIESSVEEIEGTENLEVVNKIHDLSNPNERGENGRTHCGLYRLRMYAQETGKVDEWGFVDEDAELLFIQSEVRSKQKKGSHKDVSDYKRKNPTCLEDMLTPSIKTSPFNVTAIAERIYQLQNGLDCYGKITRPKAVRGNLEYIGDPANMQVTWIPTDLGRFAISQHPEIANHSKWIGGKRCPGYKGVFSLAADPIDQTEAERQDRASDFGLTGFRHLSASIDGQKFDDDGNPVELDKWTTNQFVLSYRHRLDNIDTMYEDCVKAAIYFGCDVLIEKNKYGLVNHFRRKGLDAYIMYPPELISSGTNVRTAGVAATASTIDEYINQIAQYTHFYCGLVHHLELLKEWFKFTRDKRGSLDMAVASGWNLIASTTPAPKKIESPASGTILRMNTVAM